MLIDKLYHDQNELQELKSERNIFKIAFYCRLFLHKVEITWHWPACIIICLNKNNQWLLSTQKQARPKVYLL